MVFGHLGKMYNELYIMYILCGDFTDVCSTIHPMWCVQRWKNTFWANSGFVAGADYIQCHTYNDTPCQVAERYWIMTVPTFASFSNIYAVLIDGCPPHPQRANMEWLPNGSNHRLHFDGWPSSVFGSNWIWVETQLLCWLTFNFGHILISDPTNF